MKQFFKNLFNLNKLVDKQETLGKELADLKEKLAELDNKFNEITYK